MRGTRDFNPSQAHLVQLIFEKASAISKVFGYQEIILPILEEEGLFRKSVGETTDIVERQIFKIEGKDNIILRPEGTAQVIRYYLENSLYKQSDFYKLYYTGAMFRGERPQKGRLRQFHHIGVEAIGSDSVYLDAETIELAITILDAIGIKDKELKINTLGCTKDKEKFAKNMKEQLAKRKSKLCEDCQRRLQRNPLRVLDCKKDDCKDVVYSLNIKDQHLCDACRTHFNTLRSLLDKSGIKYNYVPHLVRGLDYYTNMVFEITSTKLGAQDAIGAGGRYNNLVYSLGGEQVPAIGFALGLERTLLLLEDAQKIPVLQVFVATTAESLLSESMVILRKIRNANLLADMDYCAKSLKAQLRRAQKLSARFVIILGEEEQKKNLVILKDMECATQEELKADEAISKISNHFKGE
ncbi:MAG: histidine--tRNA ligase [Candidatus Omnitrophota bacterium]|nr:MAG: histidine--tRNA ligase [Candidatus Omnitrophota bacterium]